MLQAVAIALLAFASSPVVLLAGAVLFGATVGNVLILAPIVLVSAFGTRDYPSIYSVNQLLTTVGIAAGPVLIGVLRDATADYTTPLASRWPPPARWLSRIRQARRDR
jgi:MFS family permease